MPMANIRGTRIHYDITGEGPPLVVTAGQGMGPEARAALLAGLAQRHTVLAYDQRGTGRSAPHPQGEPIETLGEDIVALMDHAGWARAHVLGISTGTGMATWMAAHHAARVGHLVLAAPWTHGDSELQVLQGLRMAAARTLQPDQYVHLNALLIYAPDYRRGHAERLAGHAQRALASPQDAPGIGARLDAILRFDARPLYPRIGANTLVLGARDDLVMPVWHAEAAARAIPGARLAIFADGGHLFCDTRTAQFLEKVLPFLA